MYPIPFVTCMSAAADENSEFPLGVPLEDLLDRSTDMPAELSVLLRQPRDEL